MTPVGTATREQVAAEVRAAAARQRVTQKSLATALGISQQALSRRWTGELPFETDLLAEVGHLLGMDPRDFFPPAGGAAFVPGMTTVREIGIPARRRKSATRANKVYCSIVSRDKVRTAA